MKSDVALLLVDLQNDFMPGGSLGIAGADAIVGLANAAAERAPLVIATQDWHPADHLSFASNHPGRSVGDVVELDGLEQVLWPDHCVQGTPGASFHSALDVSLIDAVVHKGIDRRVDSYSAFFDNARRRDTGLLELLGAHGIQEVYVMGLATDYCVLWTAQDARRLGLAVAVLEDATRAVDLMAGDGERALEAMRSVGCRIISSDRLD